MKKNTMNSKTHRILTLAMVGIMATSGLAFAGHGNHGNHMSMDTTSPQYQEMNARYQAYREKVGPLYRAFQSNQALLEAELLKGDTDRKRVEEIQEDISEIRTQLDRFELDHTLEMKTLGSDYAGYCGSMGNHGMGRNRGSYGWHHR
ncbi:MAG: periplasmic heavy metal sensor [Desulfobacterales bacterium]|nr:periplasmic heavy metal sensor [Desulfobacterales bacterium]